LVAGRIAGHLAATKELSRGIGKVPLAAAVQISHRCASLRRRRRRSALRYEGNDSGGELLSESLGWQSEKVKGRFAKQPTTEASVYLQKVWSMSVSDLTRIFDIQRSRIEFPCFHWISVSMGYFLVREIGRDAPLPYFYKG
jgi:hypothetical protein